MINRSFITKRRVSMTFLSVVVIIVHIILAIGVIFFALQKMRENSERGGAFGGGTGAVFGREKGLDKTSKIALTFGILFMFSFFLVTWIVA